MIIFNWYLNLCIKAPLIAFIMLTSIYYFLKTMLYWLPVAIMDYLNTRKHGWKPETKSVNEYSNTEE